MNNHRFIKTAAAVAVSVLALSSAQAAIIHLNTEAGFISTVKSGTTPVVFDFNSLSDKLPSAMVFSGGADELGKPYRALAQTPSGLSGAGGLLSSGGSSLVLKFSKNVSGVAGDFFALGGTGGSVTLSLANGKSETFSLSVASGTYAGFITGDKSVPITGMRITTPLGSKAGVDNLELITDTAIVPEPTTVVAGCFALLPFGLAALRRARK